MLVALYRRSTVLGAAIRWQTRGRVDHAAIWIGDQVIEATHPRVISRALRPDDADAQTFEIFGPLDESAVEAFLVEQVGKGYDHSSVLRFVSRRQESRKAKGKWFCSELVFAALREGGVSLFHHTEPWEVSPQLLIRSPLLRQLPNPRRT